MPTTPNLVAIHVEEAQNQKATSGNAAFDIFDGAITDLLSQAVSDAGDTTIAVAEATQNMVFDLTGALTAVRNVTVPDANLKLFVVRDSTTGGHAVTFKTVTGTGIVVSKALFDILYNDGTNIISIQSGGASSTFAGLTDTNISGPSTGDMLRWDGTDWVDEAPPVDLGGWVAGAFAATQIIIKVPFNRAVTFPAAFAGSEGHLETAATAQTDFDIQRNGSSVGTMRFAISGTVATFLGAGAAFADTDRLKILAPGSPDATAAGLGFMLQGTRD